MSTCRLRINVGEQLAESVTPRGRVAEFAALLVGQVVARGSTVSTCAPRRSSSERGDRIEIIEVRLIRHLRDEIWPKRRTSARFATSSGRAFREDALFH
jgi:hypothetical protein